MTGWFNKHWLGAISAMVGFSWLAHMYLLLAALAREDEQATNYELFVILMHLVLLFALAASALNRRRNSGSH